MQTLKKENMVKLDYDRNLIEDDINFCQDTLIQIQTYKSYFKNENKKEEDKT